MEPPALPQRITMGPYTFRVTSDPAVIQSFVDDDRTVAGISVLESGIIGVTEGPLRTHVYKADTLLHEMVHCAVRVSGYEIDPDVEEQVVSAVTPQLLHALRENPDAIAYLLYKD